MGGKTSLKFASLHLKIAKKKSGNFKPKLPLFENRIDIVTFELTKLKPDSNDLTRNIYCESD